MHFLRVGVISKFSFVNYYEMWLHCKKQLHDIRQMTILINELWLHSKKCDNKLTHLHASAGQVSHLRKGARSMCGRAWDTCAIWENLVFYETIKCKLWACVHLMQKGSISSIFDVQMEKPHEGKLLVDFLECYRNNPDLLKEKCGVCSRFFFYIFK